MILELSESNLTIDLRYSGQQLPSLRVGTDNHLSIIFQLSYVFFFCLIDSALCQVGNWQNLWIEVKKVYICLQKVYI